MAKTVIFGFTKDKEDAVELLYNSSEGVKGTIRNILYNLNPTGIHRIYVSDLEPNYESLSEEESNRIFVGG